MTTREAIYESALEHIRDGSDAVCTDCGWMGERQEVTGLFVRVCPNCDFNTVRFGSNEIAAYALAQAKKESNHE